MPELPEVETVRVGLARLLPGRIIKSTEHDTEKSFPNEPQDVKQFLVGASVIDVRRRAKVLLIELSSNYTLVTHLKMTGQLVFVRGRTSHKGKVERWGGGHPSDSLIAELPDKSTRVILTFQPDEEKITAGLESSARKPRSAEEGVQKVRRLSTGAADTAIGQERWRSFGLRPKAGQSAPQLFFNDQRKFGWMKLYPTDVLNRALMESVLESNARKLRSAQRTVHVVPRASTGTAAAAVGQELAQPAELGLAASASGTDSMIDFMKKVGPEPLEADFTWQIMRERLQRRKKTNIKAALLDQTVIAGVGNIYADESLWGAKLHPATLVKDVSDAKLKSLHKSLVDVLKLSIEKGGSSNRTYVDAEGKKGSYMSFANVFRREGLPCPRCGTTIIKTRVAGRGTHLCPHCQKSPKCP